MNSKTFYEATDELLKEISEREEAVRALEKVYFSQKTRTGCRPTDSLPNAELRQYLDEIHQLMDGTEWDSETTSAIGEILSGAGYTIRDPNEPELPSRIEQRIIEAEAEDKAAGYFEGVTHVAVIKPGPERWVEVAFIEQTALDLYGLDSPGEDDKPRTIQEQVDYLGTQHGWIFRSNPDGYLAVQRKGGA